MFMYQHRRRRRGFTLMEVLLVLSILVILGAMVGVFVGGMQREAFRDSAAIQIRSLEVALEAYRIHLGSYPNSNQGLQALIERPADLPNPAKWRGPYIRGALPRDPWDNSYQYELIGPEQFRIWSMGPDGVSGTEDDVINTQ